MMMGAGEPPEKRNFGERTQIMRLRPTTFIAMLVSALWGAATILYVLASPSQATMSWLNVYWGALFGVNVFFQVLPQLAWKYWSGTGPAPPADFNDWWSSTLNVVLVGIAVLLYFHAPPPQNLRFYYESFLMISVAGAVVDLMLYFLHKR